MTKWKQKRLEREQQLQQFAAASLPVFLDMVFQECFKRKATEEQAIKLRVLAAESAWAHAELMIKARK